MFICDKSADTHTKIDDKCYPKKWSVAMPMPDKYQVPDRRPIKTSIRIFISSKGAIAYLVQNGGEFITTLHRHGWAKEDLYFLKRHF